jgi:hypothetical protein
MQLMQGADAGTENRATELGEISRGLKSMAKGAQGSGHRALAAQPLARAAAQQAPVMSDLRESGALEQDADMIFFIYRDEVYNEESPDKGIAEIIIGKQRNGPIGTVKLTFLGKHTRFENYSGATGTDHRCPARSAPRSPLRRCATTTRSRSGRRRARRFRGREGERLWPRARARGLALKDDADGFGILELEGAVRMRQWGCRQPILLLEGFFQENELPVFAEHGFATVVHSEEQLRMLEREAAARSTSTSRSTRG